MPWQNSWFQLAVFAAAVSGLLLVGDLMHGGSTAWTPNIKKGGGYNPGNPSGSPSPSTSDSTPAPTPPPPAAPSNLPSKDANAFTNSLGMKFVSAGTPGLLVSIWDTRVEDFQAFVNATGYNATGGMYTLGSDGWKQQGGTWDKPGFDQTPDAAVVGVSWNDANAFCQWLTAKEQQSGVISAKQAYRLPTDAEWTAAVGTTTYPWGDDWPPANNEANLYRHGDGFSENDALPGADGFPYTSPVGSYAPNGYGLFDMGGNAYQLCQDFYHKEMNSSDLLQKHPDLANDGGGLSYRVMRGSSWDELGSDVCLSIYRGWQGPDVRYSTVGFRCVLTSPGLPWTTIVEIGGGLLVILIGVYFFMTSKSAKPAS